MTDEHPKPRGMGWGNGARELPKEASVAPKDDSGWGLSEEGEVSLGTSHPDLHQSITADGLRAA